MCVQCGCKVYVGSGEAAVLRRVLEIIEKLRITPGNVDDYESTETISWMIAPFGSREDQIYKAASWISSLHQENPRLKRSQQYENHMSAFEDIFARLPVLGAPKDLATDWHQLEQLARELSEGTKAALDAGIRATIEAVNRVHEDRTRAPRLRECYGL